MAGLNGVDFVLLAVVAMSTLVGILRGFVKEALSLAVWVAALWSAWRFGAALAPLLEDFIGHPMLRIWAARALTLVLALVAGSLLTWLAGRLLRVSGLSGTDRVIGMVFGLARGAIIVALCVLGLRLAGFDEQPWWRESKLIPYAVPVADRLREAVEDGMRRLQRGGAEPGLQTAARETGSF